MLDVHTNDLSVCGGLSKESAISLVRTVLSDPGSKSGIGRLGGWRWKKDAAFLLAVGSFLLAVELFCLQLCSGVLN